MWPKVRFANSAGLCTLKGLASDAKRRRDATRYARTEFDGIADSIESSPGVSISYSLPPVCARCVASAPRQQDALGQQQWLGPAIP
jgi:hypothetical protein